MNFRLVSVLLLSLCACSDGKVDTSKIKEEMKAREVRVVPEAKVIERALAIGDSIIQKMDQQKGMANAGKPIKTWNEIDPAMTCTVYSIEADYDLDQKEAGVFAAYVYSAKNGSTADPNVQRIANDIMVFNAPLIEGGKIVGMWSLHLPRRYVILSVD